MAVRLSGDFDRLERLVARAGRIASGEFRRELLQAMATKVSALIDHGFELGQDPRGNAWMPLRFRAGRPLNKSGKLRRRATDVQVTATSLFVEIDLPYANVQNYGATIRAKPGKRLVFKAGRRTIFAKQVVLPSRQFLPEGDLPQRWRDELADVVDDQLTRALRSV